MQDQDYEGAVEILKRAKEALEPFLSGLNVEVTKAVRTMDIERKRLLSVCRMHQKQELKKDKARAAAMFGGKSKTECLSDASEEELKKDKARAAAMFGGKSKSKAKGKGNGKANANRAPPPPPANKRSPPPPRVDSPILNQTEPVNRTEPIPEEMNTPETEEYVNYEPAWYQEHQEAMIITSLVGVLGLGAMLW
eukprot:CAMPEP_0171323606 /NCGR_PEP_ID=MMETSP0816-20121228/115679_1 /TAXON_ID=420281 /ORGANISM="Proboscia inermis, Strain CCAP1064/1" /LENGTH=193 /DNA_ID=CAMNT_0011822353 /DNA_START=108 /DNA_END=687 /DNA_ORIENTATION=-